MPNYEVTITWVATRVAKHTIEADSEEEANAKAADLVASLNKSEAPTTAYEWELDDETFEVESVDEE